MRASAGSATYLVNGLAIIAEYRRLFRSQNERHAELVSPCGDFVPASIEQPKPKRREAEWTLKQVQGDDGGVRLALPRHLQRCETGKPALSGLQAADVVHIGLALFIAGTRQRLAR